MANSVAEGAAFFTAISLAIPKGTKKAVTKAGRIVRDEAKRVLGTYEYGWPELAEKTIERKATGDSPLLETGAMRASIKLTVEGDRLNWVAIVGTDDPHALFQELGTIHIPPRPFLMGAAIAKEKVVLEVCGKRLFGWAVTSKAPDFEDDWSYDGED